MFYAREMLPILFSLLFSLFFWKSRRVNIDKEEVKRLQKEKADYATFPK